VFKWCLHNKTFKYSPLRGESIRWEKSTFLAQFCVFQGIALWIGFIWRALSIGHLLKKSQSGRSDDEFDLSHLNFDLLTSHHLWSPLWLLSINPIHCTCNMSCLWPISSDNVEFWNKNVEFKIWTSFQFEVKQTWWLKWVTNLK
jgi:hypothetical protein